MRNKLTGIEEVTGPVAVGLRSGCLCRVSAHATAWDVLESEVAVSTSVQLSVTLVPEALTQRLLECWLSQKQGTKNPIGWG